MTPVSKRQTCPNSRRKKWYLLLLIGGKIKKMSTQTSYLIFCLCIFYPAQSPQEVFKCYFLGTCCLVFLQNLKEKKKNRKYTCATFIFLRKWILQGVETFFMFKYNVTGMEKWYSGTLLSRSISNQFCFRLFYDILIHFRLNKSPPHYILEELSNSFM